MLTLDRLLHGSTLNTSASVASGQIDRLRKHPVGTATPILATHLESTGSRHFQHSIRGQYIIMNSVVPSRVLLASRSLCMQCAARRTQRRSYIATRCLRSVDESRLPKVVNPSFWSSLVPKPLRRSSDPDEATERTNHRAATSEERRVAIIFLVLGIVVGSNAIQIIALRRQILDFSRKTEAKLSVLREVVERVKNGEDIDVKKVLGTGEPDQEKEWEEVIKELENTDMLWEGRKKKEAKRAQKEQEQRTKYSSGEEGSQDRSADAQTQSSEVPSTGRRKFLL